MAGRRDPWVRWFDVTSPHKHSGGYTIYKVTSKVFPVHSPEATTEIVVWKRYNDFNKLHKTLFLLHRNLHRPGVFPEFPKPRVFGRFDEAIIEERRTAALELLNFLASQPHLFNSLAVQEFFETSESCEIQKEAGDQPSILQPVSTVSLADDGTLTRNSDSSGDDGELRDQQSSPTQSATSVSVLPEGDDLGERPQIEVQEEISSAADEFSIVSQVDNGTPIASHSTGGLVESLSGVWAHRHPDHSDSEQSDTEISTHASPTPATFQLGDTDLSLPTDIMNEFDPCRESSSPRQGSVLSNAQLLSECVDSVDSGGPDQSGDSLSSIDQSDTALASPADTLGEYIQSKDDYLYKAVKQIRKARREEQEGHYQIAFDYYKRTVAMLLTGVQGDNDEARRSVVKRKTAEYLVYAEQLHNQFLDSSGGDNDRWRQLQVPRHVARLRAGLTELSNFKVLGLIGRNMLVLDKSSEQTYVIKVLQKNTEVTESSWSKQVIPTKCNHMIKLIKYFETESTIYLLLEHAQGGTLWQYVHNYLQSPETTPGPLLHDGADNIYSGKKYSTTSCSATVEAGDITAQSQDPVTDATTAKGEEEECSEEYMNMLLGLDPPSTDPSAHSSADTLGDTSPTDPADALESSVSTVTQTDDVFNIDSKIDMPQPSTTRRMSLRRSNSSKSRSVSVERASDSVNSARHRNWSTVFDDLELSGNKKQARVHLPESCVQRWAAELLVAVEELHRAGLILCDLRPENLLLDSRGHVILTYFCKWPGVRQEIPTNSIEQLHVSPEGTLPGALCLASDYWSFGVLLYELLAGVSLTSIHPEGITSHTILKTPDHLSQEAEHLLKQLLRYNWRERLGGGAAGISEIKAHPFFQTINWADI